MNSPVTRAVKFRNGMPVQMTAWVDTKTSWYGRKRTCFVKLQGEVLSFHRSETSYPPEDEFDIIDASVTFSSRPSARTFRIAVGRRTYICQCASQEEMMHWVNNIQYASQRSFQRFYALGSVIEHGSNSSVHYAFCRTETSKVFAVKVIRKDSQDIRKAESIHREKFINTMVSHPSVVEAVDIFSRSKQDFIVMELMQGGSLEDLLATHGRLPESYVKSIVMQVASGLAHLHSQNIVHRDIRPDNILCSARKFPMSVAIADFGSANFTPEKRVNDEVLRTVTGLPPYVASEILRNERYGPLVDIWSLGVVLFQLLSGETPFPGSSTNEVVGKIKLGRVSLRSRAWDKISNDAKSLVMQLLQPDPFKRVCALGCAHHPWFKNSNSTASSESGSPRDPSGSQQVGIAPSVRAIATKGLASVARENPTRVQRLLGSQIVQRQLSMALPYRRRLVCVARSFIAVFRMMALAKGQSLTRELSSYGPVTADHVARLITERTTARS